MSYYSKYLKYKSKYIKLKGHIGHIGGNKTTYENIMKDNHQTTYFWKYYKHYENYSKDQIKK